MVEASLRVVRNPAKEFRGVLNIVRDISERKVSEKRLQQAYSALEAAADKDPLTDLRIAPLRPGSGQRVAPRGTRAKALSLLMIDADLFKSYNDTYGIRAGFCLRQIAEAALDVWFARRSCGAFGREEFAVILPTRGEWRIDGGA